MKRTLLEIVQSILNDMDSEAVNSISDTVEAQQIASVVEDTYYNIIAAREIPEHKQLLQITPLSDNTKPTHFHYPANTKQIELLQYNIGTSGANWSEIVFVEPIDFLNRMDEQASGVVVATDVAGGTPLYIRNDRMPSYYTSFDDYHIVMDAFDATVDNTLQQSKTRAYGTVYPTFSQTDNFEPDLDDTLLPYLLAEAKSTCFSLFKSGSDPKIEQAARRLKSYTQNDMYRTKRENKRPHYGRH
jgi:hypothetical protein